MNSPARGYSWPPFQPANGTALKHGAHTPALIEPQAAELVGWLLGVAAQPDSPIGFLNSEHFSPALDRWARAEARRLRYEAHVAEHGEFDAEGEETAQFRALRDWESRAAGHAARLGLDPASLARIRKELAETSQARNAERAHAELSALYGRPTVLDGK